ncbi:NUDIX hydrolase [Streptomyces chrestomyceticus]|uniref:NUDIX hydrolase n=1 Tax=Streptomyces chrestomyceticus TaxID=68185 RepID=UPI0033EF86E9
MHSDIDLLSPDPVRIGALALVRTDCGEVLTVHPTNGSRHFQLPGGHCRAGERLAVAGARELFEETGLTLPRGRLLAVDETDADPNVRAVGINFVYDYGVCDDPASIRLPAPPGNGEPAELDTYVWLAPDLLDEYCADSMAKRIRWSLFALEENTTVSLVRGELVGPEGGH